MHDGAPCHRTKEVTKWIGDAGIKLFQPWPARSPDLNPIEKIWAVLKAAVSERRCTTSKQLHAAILECWNAIPKEVIDATVRGVRGCAQACVKERGGLFGRRREGPGAEK